jgi:hypothetical protein
VLDPRKKKNAFSFFLFAQEKKKRERRRKMPYKAIIFTTRELKNFRNTQQNKKK